jgi:predicted permease
VFSRIRKTWNALRGRRRWEDDLDAELRSHVEMRTSDLIRLGLTTDAAERRARIELGSQQRYKEEARTAFGLHWLDDARQDAVYAFRTLRRSPGFAVTAVISMALGVGANTVVFSVLNSVFFRPLPVSDPDRLLFVNRGPSANVSYPAYRDLRDRSATIDGAVGYRPARMGLGDERNAERFWGYLATGNYFDVLGLKPAAGRFFHAEDEKGVNASPYAVISYDLWQGHFQGDPEISGRTVRINALPFTVLGVAPRGFQGTEAFISPSLWVPMTMEPQIEGFNWLEARNTHDVWMLVRAKAGMRAAHVEADFNRVARDLAREYPNSDAGPSLTLSKPGLLGNLLRKPVEQFVVGIMLMAGLVLLAACANLAGLLGARSADRLREIALRLSIGAGRGRILRQLLTESAVLTSMAGAAGCGMAWLLLRALSQWSLPIEIPVQVNVLPDIRVLLFSTAVSILTGILAGIAPARQAWRIDTNSALKGAASNPRGQRRWTTRDMALLVQTALCCLLVVCSFVAGRGLLRTFDTRPGFERKGVSVIRFDPTLARYSHEDVARFQRRALDAVSQLPGVISAAFSKSVPMDTDQSNTTLWPEDAVELRPEQGLATAYYDVSPGFFKTMATRLLAGREFDWRDNELDAAPTAIVNKTLARRLFGTTDAVGKRYRAFTGALVEVIAVVEDGKYLTFTEEPRPVVFRPILRMNETETVLAARSTLPEGAMAAQIARTVKALDPGMPVYGVGSLADSMGLAFLPAWIASIALGAFGLLAIMLAVTGIYGLAGYSVSRRVREIGIRMAVGARPLQIMQTVIGRLAIIVLIGCAVGIGLGLASGRLLATVVYQSSPSEPATLSAVALVMLTIAVVSALGPIRRAISVEPVQALRQD